MRRTGANPPRATTNPQLPRGSRPAEGTSTNTPSSSPSIELLEWRPRGSTGEFQKAQAAAAAAAPAGPPSSPAKTSKPSKKPRKARLPWLELGGLAIALFGFGFLYHLYRPPTTPPISGVESNKHKMTLVVPKKASTPDAPKADALAPGVFVVRSPGTDLKVKVDGTDVQEELPLAGTSGEMNVSSPSPPWSLKVTYERSANGLTLTIQPVPPADIHQLTDNVVLARRGEVAHVHVGRRPVLLQLGNGDGPRILMQYRGAGSE